MKQHISDSQKLHKSSEDYGGSQAYLQTNSLKKILNIPQAVRLNNDSLRSVLDYGCGKGGLLESFRKELKSSKHTVHIQGYDPAVEKFQTKPSQKFDLVTCIDVLEHIDRNSIREALHDISKYTNYIFFYSIDLIPARKKLEDGRNAHVLLAPADWWIQTLNSIFEININFQVGRNKNGSKFPVRLIGCASNEVCNFQLASKFLKSTELTNKEWIHERDGEQFSILEYKFKLK